MKCQCFLAQRAIWRVWTCILLAGLTSACVTTGHPVEGPAPVISSTVAPEASGTPASPTPSPAAASIQTPAPAQTPRSKWKEAALPREVATLAYQPGGLRQIALVPLKDFTPSGGVRIFVEEPLMGELLRALREEVNLDVVPGFIPNARSFVSALREYLSGSRGSRFPQSDFDTLKTAAPAPAYLVYWVEHSSRELVVNEDRQSVPGSTYSLKTVGVLLDVEGRVYWRATFDTSLEVTQTDPVAGYRTAAAQATQRLVDAFLGK